MPKDAHDVLHELSEVWCNLTEEQRDSISEMIAGAKVYPASVCNLCGKPLDEWDAQEDFHMHTHVGYGSVHDMEEVDLRLCCDCFDKLVGACTVSPVVEYVNGGELF